MKNANLFRSEAVTARQAQYLGAIRIGQNPTFVWVAACALILAALLISYGTWGEMTRKARLSGLLVPVAGTLTLSAPQAGTVIDLRVKEGDAVIADQVLMVVRTDRATQNGDTSVLVALSLEQRRTALRSERSVAEIQYRQRQEAADDRARSLATEVRGAEAELDAARHRLELAKKNVERYNELVGSGFVSQIQAQQKQEELLDVVIRESSAERNLVSLRQDLQSLSAEHTSNASALQAQLIQMDRSLASLEQEGTENNARRELVVTSPTGGTVTALTAIQGQVVQPGQTLAVVVPFSTDGHPSPLVAQLFAPSRTAGSCSQGSLFGYGIQPIHIKSSGWPKARFKR